MVQVYYTAFCASLTDAGDCLIASVNQGGIIETPEI